MEKYGVRYIKLHFELNMTDDTTLPINKASAIRGGIGEMLLRANCIADRDCDNCDFESECIVQRTMYSKFDREVKLVGDMNSVGYVIECNDYREDYKAGDILLFNLLLFGKTIVYFNQYLQAVYTLGQNGLGKYKSTFTINQITNNMKQPILDGYNVNMSAYRYGTLSEYIASRRRHLKKANKIVFKTPLTLKHNGRFMQKFDVDLIVKAVQRRLYILNCFEGNYDSEIYESDLENVKIITQDVTHREVTRYSNRKESKMTLRGITGEIEVDSIPDAVLDMLLAGEIIHVGKNTTFGFGQYYLN